MEQWNTCPHALKQKTIFTLLTGTCCMGITVPVFLLSKDHVLLALGSCFFLCSLLRALSLTGQTFLGYEELPDNLLCPPAE